MKPEHTDPRRMALVAASAAALLVAIMVVPADADSSGGSSRSQVSRSSGSSGGSSSSSSRSAVSSRSGSSSSQGGSAVRSRGSGSSVSGSSGSRGRAVVTRPSHGRVPPRSSSGGHHFHHGSPHSFRHFGFGFYGYYPYWSWGYPYYGYGHGYGYYPPVVYASTPGYGMGALDLNVRPKQTEVFVNGQYVGLVKQYDGFPGYLWLESGLYQVAFYRAGYETVFREFEIFTGMVLDVAIEMVPGEAVLPQRAEERPSVRGAEQAPAPYEPREEPRVPAQAPSTHVDLSVDPEEASVYLDGRFVGTGRELADGLTVAAGQHVMEVVLPGYEQETVRFEARPGLDSAVDVRLEPVGSTGG